jgi:hypothetical protein
VTRIYYHCSLCRSDRLSWPTVSDTTVPTPTCQHCGERAPPTETIVQAPIIFDSDTATTLSVETE